MQRNSGPIDFSRLEEMAGIDDDGGLVEQIISMFVHSVPGRLAALHAARTAGDGHALTHAAHALKGSASNIGANQLAEICGVIEQHAGSGPLHSADAELARVDTAGTDAINTLRLYVSRRATPPRSAG